LVRTLSAIIGLVFFVCLLAFTPKQAAAGAVEFSFGFSFNKSNYSGSSYSWTRRWGTSIGYYFGPTSQIELAYQDVTDRSKIVGYEDTTFHDKIYSVNLVQELMPKKFPVQPYVKAGVGQLNRSATGMYAWGASPPLKVDSITGVLGAGLRIYITRTFGIRSEATTYLAGGAINKWKDNVGFTVGASFFF